MAVAVQWLFISATGAARRSPVCKGSFKLQCETNLQPDLLGDLQSASRAVALRDLRPAGASTVLRGSLNCSAVLETAALQALRKLENCSVHLRFRCLCSLLHIWICLEEEQSSCTEKPLDCSALLQKAALQALRKLENCSVHLRFRCLCSLLHIWICLEEEQSSCTEKPLDCSALLQKAALQALRKLENCSVHLRFRCLCSLLHIWICLREEQLHRKAPN